MRSTVWVVDPKLSRDAAEGIVALLASRGVTASLRDLPAGLAVVADEPPGDLAPPEGIVRTATVELPSVVTRRAFLDAFAGALVLTVAAAGAGVAAAFASPPPGERRDDDAEIEVTTLTELAAKGSVRFRLGSEPCILISREGRLHALSLVCTHLGCLVEWRPELGQLTCPCHKAAFGIEGNVIEGPPPRPLASLAVSVVGDRVLVRRRTAS